MHAHAAGAAGLLTVLVPGSMLVMVSATVLSKNVYRAVGPETSEEQAGRLAKVLVPVVALVALIFSITSALDLVFLRLLVYTYVTQVLPALLFSLRSNNFVSK